MERTRKIILDEIEVFREVLSGYSNVLIKDDEHFLSFINLFGLKEDIIKETHLVVFKRLDDINFRLLLIYDDKIIIDDFEMSESDGFDKAINYGKQLVGSVFGGFFNKNSAEAIDFEPISASISDIDNVFYIQSEGVIVFELQNIEEPVYLDENSIKEKGNDPTFFRYIASLIRNLSIELGELTDHSLSFDDTLDKLGQLSLEDDYEQMILVTDEFLDAELANFEKYFIFHYRAIALYRTDELLEAKKYIDMTFDMLYSMYGDFSQAESWLDQKRDFYTKTKNLSANINYQLKDYEKSLWEINDAYFLTGDNERKEAYSNNREEILDDLMENFSELDFHKRKVIYVNKDLPSFKPDTIFPLRIDKLGSLKFPPSHPAEGELYVAHPFKSNHYYPIENHEQILFESQFVELNHLLQCLGATEIRSEHVKGSLLIEESVLKKSGSFSSHYNQKGGVDNKLFIVNADRDVNRSNSGISEQNSLNKSESGKRLMSVQQFSPKKSPYIPDDLVWYAHNETWQKLAQQRLQGGLNYYEMVISSNSVKVINEREKSKINNEYKSLISGGLKNAKSNLNVSWGEENYDDSENDIMSAFSKEDTNEWKLIVSFAPVDELNDGSTLIANGDEPPLLEANELRYIEDIKFAIEDDGVIDSDERRMLERNQTKYKISNERAKELENELLNKSQFTAEEQEFIDEVRLILEHDGEVCEGDRRILLRLASRLDITEQRAEELEKHVMMNGGNDTDFTEQEQQYIEELNFCLEEGPEISRSGRRLLDRTIKSLGISEERAAEIEEIVQAQNR